MDLRYAPILGGGAARARHLARRVDDADMREGLRKVAEHPLADRIVFLGQQPDVVAQPEQSPVRRGVRSTAILGPAIARSAPFSSRVTQGTHEPKSKRTTSSMRIGTWPRSPATMRTRSETAPRIGMKSITVAALPSGNSNRVSRIKVPSR